MRARLASTSSRLEVPRSGHDPRRQRDDGAHESEHAIHGDSDEPERNQADPDQRISDERQHGERPAQHEEDAPEQKLHAAG